jgi:hypothetical protein
MAVRWELYFENEKLVLKVLMLPNLDKRGLEVAARLWCALGHNN